MPQSVEDCWSVAKGALHSWILLTYLHLKANQFPCQLVGNLPNEGIILAFRDSIPNDFRPGRKMLLICLQAERGRHPFAQLHVVQNLHHALPQSMPRSDRYLFPGTSFHIKHWSQPGLIPRRIERGDRFENVAFMGRGINLAPELKSEFWQNSLRALGLQWLVIEDASSWRDYSEIDAIIAIRSFDGDTYPAKPASKLCNAWLAGVPAIVGCDSAFELERKSDLDFLKAASLEATISAVKQLQNNKALWNTMVANGFDRSKEIAPSAIFAQWQDFLLKIAVPAYQDWGQRPFAHQKIFLAGRNVGLKIKQMSGTLAS